MLKLENPWKVLAAAKKQVKSGILGMQMKKCSPVKMQREPVED